MKAAFKPKNTLIRTTNRRIAALKSDASVSNILEGNTPLPVTDNRVDTNICNICKVSLSKYLDVESNSCSNCGAVCEYDNLDTNANGFLERQSGIYVNETAVRSNSNIPSLYRWGWTSSNDASLNSKNKRLTDNASKSTKENCQRSLEDQYYRKEFGFIKDGILTLSRLLGLQLYTDRAFFLSRSALSKRLTNGKFFKMGQEGKLVGAACLKVSGSSPHALGSIYKRVKRHLGIKSEYIEPSSIVSDIIEALYLRIIKLKKNNVSQELSEFKQLNKSCAIPELPINSGTNNITLQFTKTVEVHGSSSLIKMATRIVSICNNLCLSTGRNTSQVVGAAVLTSIYILHFKMTGNIYDILSKIDQNEIYMYISEIVVCSLESLKSNIKIIIFMISKIANSFKWLFGQISEDFNCLLVAEKIIDFYEKLERLKSDSLGELSSSVANNTQISIENGSNSKHNKESNQYSYDIKTEIKKSNDTLEIYNSILKLEKDISAGLLNGNEVIGPMHNSFTGIKRNKDVSGVFNSGLSTGFKKFKPINLEDNEKFEDNMPHNQTSVIFSDLTTINKKINPQSFLKVQKLSFKRLFDFKVKLDTLDIRYTSSVNKKLQSHNLQDSSLTHELGASSDYSKDQQEYVELSKMISHIEKIKTKILKNEQIDENDILLALYFLGCPLESILSLNKHTLYDILGSKLRSSEASKRDLDASELSDIDLTEKESKYYIIK
ncbi:hypothetical protein BB561_002081 [Smittium simulii]|uniref:Uncharacterized protein n=1 Tax=Smittium simulii TaxID=133385 RepID=A0A2T9YRR6_9FUNG|nr:hypothetical protein BB561_002081 [Smittium simulii]